MKISKFVVWLLVAAVMLPYYSVSQAQAKSEGGSKLNKNYASGEIIVKLKDGKKPSAVDSDVTSWQSAIKGKWQMGKQVFRKKVREGEEDAQIKKLSQNPNVEYAEPNYIFESEMEPNDPYYSSSASWGQGFDDLWGVKNINASAAWDISQGEGITVAVIDSGIDYNHPDLAANIWINDGETGLDANGNDKKLNGIDDDNNGYVDDWHGWDATTITTATTGFDSYINGDKAMDNDPMDDDGHGTHVAGTIAAVGNNSIGVIGVAPKVKIMPVKFLTQNGGTTSDAVTALLYAAENGARVINNSWGGGGHSQLLADTLKYIHDELNAVVVAAAGNASAANWTHAPSAYPEVISVAASTPEGSVANYSSYGKVDVTAPGSYILSAKSSQGTIDYDIVGQNYQVLSGTSMASPHVSGTAALILSKSPALSSEIVRQILIKSADDLNAPGFDLQSGAGKINAFKALSTTALGAALITSPIGNQSPGQLPVYGQISELYLDHYSLSYGAGAEPIAWQEIASGATVPSEGLLGTFEAANLAFGEYTLKLSVYDSFGSVYENRRYLNLGEEFTLTSIEPEIISPNEAIIRWQTNRESDENTFEYGKTSDYGQTVECEGYYPEPFVRLIGLEPATTYHYRITESEFAHLAISPDRTFTTPAAVVEISNIQAIAEPHSITLTWQTNVPTTSEIEYDDNYFHDYISLKWSKKVIDSNLSTDHSVAIPSTEQTPFDADYIVDGQEYRYLIRAKDGTGNMATSGQHSVTPPQGTYANISNVLISEIGDGPVDISWQTDISSKSVVEYYTEASGSGIYYSPIKITDDNYATEHQVTIGPLWSSSAVWVSIYAISPDNSLSSVYHKIETPTTNHLTNLGVNFNFGVGTVTWQTDLPSNEAITYICPGDQYQYFSTELNTAATPDHSYPLSNLPSDSDCTLRVRSIDSEGRKLLSEPINFHSPLEDSTPPAGSLTIAGGATYTNQSSLKLQVPATDDTGVAFVLAKGQDDLYWTWYRYQPEISFLVQNDGANTVSVKFRDYAGNESQEYSDSIILDRQAPIVFAPSTIENPTSNPRPTLTWEPASDSLSGIDHYSINLTKSNGLVVVDDQILDGTSFVPQFDLLPGVYFASVYAVDRAGNVGNHGVSYNLQIMNTDTISPNGSVYINSNAGLTNSISVTLNLAASDNVAVTQMQLSYDNVIWLPWETYTVTRTWNLTSGNGTRTVYARYRDAAGNASPVYSDSIVLDALAPTGSIVINANAAYASTTAVTLTVSAADVNGISEIQVSNDGITYVSSPFSATKSWNLTPDNGTKSVYLRIKDMAGNLSPVYADIIILDTVAPTGSIIINSGATDTKTQNVTLKLTVQDAISGLNQMRFSNDGITWSAWQMHASTKSWTLASGKGTKYVYAQFSDKAGNISANFVDSITRK